MKEAVKDALEVPALIVGMALVMGVLLAAFGLVGLVVLGGLNLFFKLGVPVTVTNALAAGWLTMLACWPVSFLLGLRRMR